MSFASFMKYTLSSAAAVLLLAGCSQVEVTPEPIPAPTPTGEPGIGAAVCWADLPGWEQDTMAEALPALLSQCNRLGKSAPWQQICQTAEGLPQPAADWQLRELMTRYFTPHQVLGNGGQPYGLFTGYYEPTLRGNLTPSRTYHYPLYKKPNDLLTIKLDDRFPELKGQRVRGRLEGKTVLPYYSRADIDGKKPPLKGQELIWLDDPDAAFFLHIQGSGRVVLPNGELVGVGYADQNGHPYVAIGKLLIEQGELTREEVSLQTIRNWLKNNPQKAEALKNKNPSYVFFTLRDDAKEGPRGSLNVPLTPERSVAIDRRIIPLGTPLWISTDLPDTQQAYQRLVFAQDTGGAINGPVRADVFFGLGERAEQLAGTMKQQGKIFALLPKTAATDCP